MRTRPNPENLDDEDEQAREALEDARIDQALRESMREALILHKRAGNPIAVCRDRADR